MLSSTVLYCVHSECWCVCVSSSVSCAARCVQCATTLPSVLCVLPVFCLTSTAMDKFVSSKSSKSVSRQMSEAAAGEQLHPRTARAGVQMLLERENESDSSNNTPASNTPSSPAIEDAIKKKREKVSFRSPFELFSGLHIGCVSLLRSR